MHSENRHLLLHDIRAALVNHEGLQQEVRYSLQELSRLLESIVPPGDCQGVGVQNESEEDGCVIGQHANAELRQQIRNIFTDDLDACLPMLQLSSRRLSTLLSQLVSEEIGVNHDATKSV